MNNLIKLDNGLIVNIKNSNIFKIEPTRIIISSMGMDGVIEITENDYKNICKKIGIDEVENESISNEV